MYDRTLVLDILHQIEGALRKIRDRSRRITNAEELTASPEGEERLDGRCMLFIAIAESLRNLDKITGGVLFAAHPEIDWKGAMGFRDVIAHRYFDIDVEQVWWIYTHDVGPPSEAIHRMIDPGRAQGSRLSAWQGRGHQGGGRRQDLLPGLHQRDQERLRRQHKLGIPSAV
jgi:uncharacterized protein with HEPN domain